LIESAASAGNGDARALGEAVAKTMVPRIDYKSDRKQTRHAVFDCAIRGEFFVGEDYLFCRRVREAGETIWLYLPAQLGHVSGANVFRCALSRGFGFQFDSLDACKKFLALAETLALRLAGP